MGLLILLFILWIIIKIRNGSRNGRNGPGNSSPKQRKRRNVGTDQEQRLARLLIRQYGADRVFCNVLIPWHYTTAEIDILLLFERGIVVIEAKDYSGKIYGSEDGHNWAEYISGRKYSFYNPVLQNNRHISALAAYLGISQEELFSYIVFDDACELMSVPDDTEHCVICYGSRLVTTLNKRLMASPVLYSEEQLVKWSELLRTCEATEDSMEQHISDVKTKCPRCGGTLIQRLGPNGYFYGCSNYPKCEYTRNM